MIRKALLVSLVGLACADPCTNCFCPSLGGGPASEENVDAIMFNLGDTVYLKTITEKCKGLEGALSGTIENAGDAEKSAVEKQAGDARKKIQRSIETEGIPEKLPPLVEAPENHRHGRAQHQRHDGADRHPPADPRSPAHRPEGAAVPVPHAVGAEQPAAALAGRVGGQGRVEGAALALGHASGAGSAVGFASSMARMSAALVKTSLSW